MKKHFVSALVVALVLGVVGPIPAAAFSLVDEQPLFSAQQTESGIAQQTKYTTWLRPSLEKAGWIKKGQVIDAKSASAIEVRLCREFLGKSDADCQNSKSTTAYLVINALAYYSSLDKTSAPDSLLTSAAIKKAVASRISQVATTQKSSCNYSFFIILLGVCPALDLGLQGFPGVTKTTAAKYVRNAENRYKDLLSQVSSLDSEKRKAYESELAKTNLASDVPRMQSALAKKQYTEAYLAAVTFGWAVESVTIQLQVFLEKRSPVSSAMVAERKKVYERELSRFQQQHLVRGTDDVYLLRYGVYARNLRNLQETINRSSFTLLRTDEQLAMYDFALDIMSLIDMGAKAKI